MKYNDLKTGIRDHLNNAAEDFFMVGYFLRQISENTLFIEDGYKSIWEFAKGEYGLSTSSASRFMAINARFSIDNGEHMDQKYIGMGPSKLQEMLGLSDEDLEKVTKETTVKELRAMKAAKLSFYKLPATVRPEGSLLTIKGCGDGKHDCFSCCHPCNIRQEERLCIVSTISAGQGCPNTTEDFLKDIEAGMYKNECQFVNLELAKTSAGDGEPIPCCLNCKYKGLCFSSCDVAKKKHQEEIKENQKRLQKEQAAKEKEKREAAERAAAEAARKAEEAARAKQEPTDEEIKKLFDYFKIGQSTTPEQDLDPKNLKKEHMHHGYWGENLRFECEANGVVINNKKRITWLKLSKALTAVFNSVQPGEEQQQETEPEEQKPEVVDAEFKEVEEVSEKPAELCEVYAELDKAEVIEEPDPEAYTAEDVKELLEKYERDLKAIRKTGLTKPLKKNRIIVEALRSFYELTYIFPEQKGEEENYD